MSFNVVVLLLVNLFCLSLTGHPSRCVTELGGICKAICDGTNEMTIPHAGCCHGQCCVCVDNLECRCSDSCLESEIEDIMGECCDTTKKCCTSCTLTSVCEVHGAGSCQSTCGGEFPIDNGLCCDGSQCCLECNACTDGGGFCVANGSSCPPNFFDTGSCCGNQHCCSAEARCDELSPPHRCIHASDDSCRGGPFIGFCPFHSDIKCCPYCGFLCGETFGGECRKQNECSATVSTEDCCSPDKCCYTES